MSVTLVVITMALSVLQTPQRPAPPTIDLSVEVVGKIITDFSTTMDDYARLRDELARDLPPLEVTDDPARIRIAERALAERIRRARADAGRGDIFTDEIRREFKRLLRPVANDGTCEAIADDNPREFQYSINAEYPKDKPVSTVPASMLAVLPRLPAEIYYRFLGRDLILHDARANVILDRIDDAIPCD